MLKPLIRSCWIIPARNVKVGDVFANPDTVNEYSPIVMEKVRQKDSMIFWTISVYDADGTYIRKNPEEWVEVMRVNPPNLQY